MKSFSELGLDPKLVKAVEEQGYSKATPIQQKAIPPILLGRDIIGAAQTGTGKTASFTLPVLQRLLDYANPSMSPAKHPVRCLILTPTRELAVQVYENVVSYSRYSNLKPTVFFGGVSINEQLERLGGGVEIIVSTPGRLLDIIQNSSINFRNLGFLVLDEADRMLDMGFLPDITKIISILPTTRQTMLFSATYTEEIEKVADKWLNHPVKVDASPPNSLTKMVNHCFFKVEEGKKREFLLTLLTERKVKQLLIFCNTKIGANKLTKDLIDAKYSVGVIHGDRPQVERLEALSRFKNGSLAILVATDIAARGLDIEDMPLVINYDIPTNPEDYVHRSGRTGRAGYRGEAVSFATSDDEANLLAIERFANLKVNFELKDKLSKSVAPRFESNEADGKKINKNVKDLFFTKPYESGSEETNITPKPNRERFGSAKKRVEIPALFLPPIQKPDK